MKKKEARELILFFTIVISLSYFVFWGPISLFKVPTINLVGGSRGPIWAIILFIIGGFIPSITGIILTRIYEGKSGMKQLFKNSVKFKIGFKWIFIILLIALYYSLSLILLNTILGNEFDYSQFWLQLPTILPLIILGPLSEEYGWRGFALKRLLKLTNASIASLVIGIVWSLWHLPLFYMLGTSQYELNVPFIAFFISVTCSSFIYTYIYIKTDRSIFSAIFLHWIYTYVLQVVSSSVTRTNLYNWLEFIPSLIICIVFIFLLQKKKLDETIQRSL